MKKTAETNQTNEYKDRIITIPNILSLIRILMIPLIVKLYYYDNEYIWAGLVLILSGLTDIVDGHIARKYHMISDVGKVLDPIADKLTQAAILICLVTRYPLMLLPLIFLVLKEIFMGISGLMVYQKTKVVMGAEWHGKAATALLYGMMILHMFWVNIPEIISGITIVASAVMIAISFFYYAVRNINILKK